MRIGIKNFMIGNYYQSDKEIQQVEPWTFDCYKHDGLEPIPLTEEWLVKMGFEKRIDRIIGNVYTYGINKRTDDFMLSIQQTDVNKNDFFYRNSFHRINYLHQLQNLYFALTVEELTIK